MDAHGLFVFYMGDYLGSPAQKNEAVSISLAALFYG